MSHRSRALALGSAVALILGLVVTGAGGAAGAPSAGPVRFVRHVPSLSGLSSTASLRAAARPTSNTSDDEAWADAEFYREHHAVPHRSPKGGRAIWNGDVAPPRGGAPSRIVPAAATIGWEGSNHFDSRYSGAGNQFSGEPADQGLCASNTRVFEIVNSVVQVYDTSGNALLAGTPFFPGTGPVGLTLNEFYGLPPAFVRPNGPFGPFMFDVACLFDHESGRWFVTSADLEQDPATGSFTGENGTYIAVSTTSNPLGGWNIWFVDTANNGTGGTPDHDCSGGFCFGDYPQIGIDDHGFYLTTNEFDLLLNGEFKGAQLYAFSKSDLVAGDAAPTMQYIESVVSETAAFEAYTMQPVNAVPAEFDRRDGGVMYFGMSMSPFADAAANQVVLWGLSNTTSLNTNSPELLLQETAVNTESYSVPSWAQQRPGPTPLLDCVNKLPCNGVTYPHQIPPLPMDPGNSGKIYGAWQEAGVVYLTTGTQLAGSGGASFNSKTGKWKPVQQHTGIAYFALRPTTPDNYAATRVRQGYISVENANLTYPSVAVNAAGRGVISATLVGPTVYPSHAIIPWDAGSAPGNVMVVGAGVGPWDGFTGTGEGDFDPRWGDYGAASVAPNGTVWTAAQYIAQRCTFEEWSADTTCGATRTFLANWSTHIAGYTP